MEEIFFLTATGGCVTSCPCWAPGRRVGFPPLLSCQTLPSLWAVQPNPSSPYSHSSCESSLLFLVGKPIHIIPCPVERKCLGSPGRLSPQGRKAMSPFPTFKNLLLWQPAEHFCVVLFAFMV